MELPTLTTTEIKIMDSLRKGLSNRQISDENNISVNTVKFHLKNIFHKLGASNRVEAIIKSNNNIKTSDL